MTNGYQNPVLLTCKYDTQSKEYWKLTSQTVQLPRIGHCRKCAQYTLVVQAVKIWITWTKWFYLLFPIWNFVLWKNNTIQYKRACFIKLTAVDEAHDSRTNQKTVEWIKYLRLFSNWFNTKIFCSTTFSIRLNAFSLCACVYHITRSSSLTQLA